MTTYAFPSITPNSTLIEMVSNTGAFISPPSGSVTTRDRSGERWRITLTYVNMTNAQRAEMSAFLVRLNGQQHRFTLQNHAENNQGAFGGTPLVNGASQTGNTLNIDGCSLSITDWMKAGDWFAVNGELKMATVDADSDGSGETTLTFAPRLRASPANNDPITTSGATGTFMLADNTVSWSNDPGNKFSNITIVAIEDIAG